jgi:hypothetical protein
MSTSEKPLHIDIPVNLTEPDHVSTPCKTGNYQASGTYRKWQHSAIKYWPSSSVLAPRVFPNRCATLQLLASLLISPQTSTGAEKLILGGLHH